MKVVLKSRADGAGVAIFADGSWIKKIVFNFPVPVDGEEVKELPLETETTVECVVLLTKGT